MPSAVIFDVGGVLIDWNPRHLYRKLFGGDDAAMERFLADVCTMDWNLRQDAGRPFAEAVADLAALHPEHAALIEAYDSRWEEMVPGPVPGSEAIVRALKARGVPLYALTNFSREKFALTRARFAVLALFDGIVVSAEIGLVKPDPAIYHHLLDCFGLAAGDCVFIDDNAQNVAAAAALGMTAIRFTSAEALARDLAGLGLG